MTDIMQVEGLCIAFGGLKAVDGVSFTAERNKITTVIGPNGAGKSTAVAVLLGLLAPDQGQVTLEPDDAAPVRLADISLSGWWAQISWVPQRPVAEPGTVRDRADPAGRASEAELARVARLTGLDEIVAGLPDGWETQLGQGGSGFSLGQRQRLALTRALLEDRPLVVLDEPTAHLDAAAESQVLAVVDDLRRAGRTVLLVAHRPALLAVADDVVHVTAAQLTAQPSAQLSGAGDRSAAEGVDEGADKGVDEAVTR